MVDMIILHRVAQVKDFIYIGNVLKTLPIVCPGDSNGCPSVRINCCTPKMTKSNNNVSDNQFMN